MSDKIWFFRKKCVSLRADFGESVPCASENFTHYMLLFPPISGIPEVSN